jgi:murein peptide amidase A
MAEDSYSSRKAPDIQKSSLDDKFGTPIFRTRTRNLFVQLPRRNLLFILITLFGTLVVAYFANYYRPQTVAFSYAGSNCLTLPTLLPGSSQHLGKSFSAEPVPAVSLGKIVLYAHTTCITPHAAPAQNSSERVAMQLPGLTLFDKQLTVSSGAYPQISRQGTAGERISTKDKLRFNLSQADGVFAYRIRSETKAAACTPDGLTLHCDVPSLQLAQAAAYELAVERNFASKPVDTALTQTLQTVEPIRITSSSITSGQTIYNAPADLTLTLNKPAGHIGAVTLKAASGPEQTIPVEATVSGTSAKIAFKQPLPRNIPLVLTVADVTSADGGYLPEPYTLAFATSGGPKVSRINIGTYNVSSGQAIVLTFDSTVGPGQDLQQFIRVESGGVVSTSITSSGNQATIRPAGLGACAGFTVRVLDGLKNEHGITGGSAWQFSSRITCKQPFSIGTSVGGRGIAAYRFGSGANKIVYIGGTHGNERSSVTILNRWIDQLETQAHRIPARTSVIVIPALNPDGYADSRRTNARNVDLNRNFPANNWKSGVTLPDKSFLPAGGGTAPLSEPESRAVADYLVAQRPRLVLTYHASGNVVIPNDSGDSVGIARQYADKSSVYYASNAQTGTIFEYDTTGAMEDWLHDKHGITTILIELLSHTSNDYGGHENALWWTAGL